VCYDKHNPGLKREETSWGGR